MECKLLGAHGAVLVLFLMVISLQYQGTAGLYFASSSSNKQIPAMEVDVLLDFKTSYIRKGSQHTLGSWNSSSAGTVCESWLGITCTRSASGAYHHIHSIDLSNLKLAGSFTPRLCNLTFLYILDMSQNHLTGNIPPQLHGCRSLRILNLNNNFLSGTIPSSLSSFSSLEGLGLCNNTLNGHIPPALLSNCTSLLELSLCQNALSGSIPADLGLHLPNLQFLYLWENNISGAIPPSLGNCIGLTDLFLFSNKFTGPIPPSLGNCTSLVDVEIDTNQLTGHIPSELGLLNKVQSLYVDGNSLTGVLPPSLGNCTALTDLEASGNQLTGPIPAELGFLSHLKVLFLAANELSGAIPANLAMCTNLTTIQLQFNQLTGHIPAEVGQLHHLQQLALGDNMLTGEIPWQSLTNITSLFFLDLSNNHLNGGIPSILGKLAELKKLYLQGNLLRGEFPSFSKYTAFTLLDVNFSFNQLNGSLPESLANVLRTIVFSLGLSHNQFSGSLPIWLSQITQVQTIDLSNNNFVGSIPESLGSYANLVTLNLSRNHLYGQLPSQLANALNLKVLDLSNNNFSGALPAYLGTLHHLQSLDVSFNNLSGPIPRDGVFNHLNESFFLGNPQLCGPILKRECVDSQLSEEHRHHHISHWQLQKHWEIPLLALISSILLSIIGLVVLLVVRRYCLLQGGTASSNRFIGKLAGAKRYSAEELLEATQGYSEGNLLGQGGLSVVYKGVLRDGTTVAVKKMKDVYSGGEALLREMRILCKLRHRNLVRVLGCVLNLDVKALILEYMENGSLECYLTMHREQADLSEELNFCELSYWEIMTKVAVSVAKALAYLHHEYDVPIIHGDVKPSNILFDSNMEPHLADFGLARLISGGAQTISLSSDFKGSIGYMAPEYALAARITTKVDVYAYGVVLLGMLTGRKPTQVDLAGLSLHEWVRSKLPSNDDSIANIEELLDASLLKEASPFNNIDDSTYSHPCLSLLRMGLACTMENPKDRPTIHEVLGFLIRHSSGPVSQLSLNST